MRIVKRILTGLLVSALAVGANAQAEKNERHPHKNHVQKMKEELGLSTEQEAQMKVIKDKYHPQIKAIKEKNSLTEEQKRAQIKPLKDSKDAEVKAVLTPEQYTKLTEMRKKKHRKKRNDKIMEQLNLSADQELKMKAIKKEYRPKMKAVKENTTLSDSDKKAQLKQLKKGKNAAIKKTLTTDQYKLYKELKKKKCKNKSCKK